MRRLTAGGVLLVGFGIVALVAAGLESAITGPADASPSPTSSVSAPATIAPTLSPRVTRTPDVQVDLPASIDATGTEDVTALLQRVLDDAPDGSLVRFPGDGRYRVDGTLLLDNRRDLVIDGQGATLFATERGDDPERAVWRIRSGQGITLLDFAISGAHPDPGTYVRGFEWQHGVAIEGGRDIELDRLVVERVMGDCVYVTSDAIAWADGIWVHDSTCRDTGRQGIAVVAGRDIRVERSIFGGIPLSVLDLEPEPTGAVLPQGARDIAFIGNTVDGPVGSKLLNATGVGPISDVLVEGTAVSGTRWGIWSLVVPQAGSPRYQNVVFRDNHADGAFVGRGHPVLLFWDVDGLVIEGNRQQIDSAAAAIRLVRTCNVILRGNDLGPVGHVEEEPGPCP